jgi:16S rRNA (uracil1498-N3)-methyltransferase
VGLRSVNRPGPERAAARVHRWAGIAREAAELAHRAAVPTVAPIADLDGALAALPEGSRVLACTVDAEIALARL